MAVVFFFSFLVKWFAVKLNKPPKISLVQGINWLTTWPISPLEKQWSLWDIGSDLRLAYGDFFSWKVQKMVFYSTRCMLFLFYIKVLFTFTHFLCLLLQHLLFSSSRDRDGKAAKDEKGKKLCPNVVINREHREPLFTSHSGWCIILYTQWLECVLKTP